MLYIFDWDGTLCDSLDLIAEAIDQSSRIMGFEPLGLEKNKSVIGLGLREALQALYPNADESEMDRFIDLYIESYLALDAQQPSRLYSDAMDTLEGLKSKGHKVAVATGKSRRGLDRGLKKLDLVDYFDASRCADETRSKPHPMMLDQILAEMARPPTSAVMVGDTDFDLLMANAANVEPVGVSYGAHDEARLNACQPSRILNHLSELLF